MNDFVLTKQNLEELFTQLQEELSNNHSLVVSVKSGSTGNWSMQRLWRVWIKTVSDWMAQNGATMPLVVKDGQAKGVRPFNADDGHELFSSHFLPNENGQRISWSKKGREGQRAATKGERYHALRQLEQFALERGIQLLKPKDSEYEGLKNECGD